MAKKKNSKKKSPPKNKKKKSPKKNPVVADKKTNKKPKKQKTTAIRESEKHDLWKKNFILAGIVILLVLLNAGIYFTKHRGKVKSADSSKISKQTAVEKSDNQNNNVNPPEDKEEEKNDKLIQDLLKEKEMENWKTYQNKTYGFQIKYPEDWPDPAVSGPQDGFKFRNKISFLGNQSDSGKAPNGFDIDIYRSTQSNNKPKPDYTDNLALKDTVTPDYSNCNSLEIFSVGTAEYPALQVRVLQNDPCFHEAYFFSLRKGFSIYDIVPNPSSGKNYDGYDGEKIVKNEFPDFYRILSTLSFTVTKPVVNNQIQNPTSKPKVAPKVEAPRVTRGIRCPEKIQHPKSSPNKGKHVDEDCCPDPDEYPKAGCAYSSHDFSIMLKGHRK